MGELFNPPDSNAKRRDLRHNATPMERALWPHLQGKQRQGYKFRRQFGVGPYILDFYCLQVRLCLELDGETHQTEEAKQHDQRRDQYLRSLRIHTLRFPNDMVRNHLDEVIQTIDSYLIASGGKMSQG